MRQFPSRYAFRALRNFFRVFSSYDEDQTISSSTLEGLGGLLFVSRGRRVIAWCSTTISAIRLSRYGVNSDEIIGATSHGIVHGIAINMDSTVISRLLQSASQQKGASSLTRKGNALP